LGSTTRRRVGPTGADGASLMWNTLAAIEIRRLDHVADGVDEQSNDCGHVAGAVDEWSND
jgi:hypothetical protein